MKQMWSKEEINNAPKVLDSLVDSAGNPRFIEGAGVIPTITGVTNVYNKWSLSGSHLMIVLSDTVADTTALSFSTTLASYSVPSFILNKIVGVVGSTIEYKTATLYASDFSNQTLPLSFRKVNEKLEIATNANLTLTKDRTFRIQFDLLIDTE